MYWTKFLLKSRTKLKKENLCKRRKLQKSKFLGIGVVFLLLSFGVEMLHKSFYIIVSHFVVF